jgi:hypothetical protein
VQDCPDLHVRPYATARRADVALVELCGNGVVAGRAGPHDLIDDGSDIGGVAMNEVYGVSKAEAATPTMAQERAAALKDQFMDMHTHFLRDDTRIMTFVNMRNAVGKAGWNKQLAEKEQTIDDLKFNNYKKEIFLDSDTKISLISSAPSDIDADATVRASRRICSATS